MQTQERKIGRNRGKPRLWIEGDLLIEAGLPHRAQWVLIPHIDGLDIVRVQTEESKLDGRRVRKIAGTGARPIVDIAGSSLAPLATFGTPWDSVALHYEYGSGVIAVRFNENRNTHAK